MQRSGALKLAVNWNRLDVAKMCLEPITLEAGRDADYDPVHANVYAAFERALALERVELTQILIDLPNLDVSNINMTALYQRANVTQPSNHSAHLRACSTLV